MLTFRSCPLGSWCRDRSSVPGTPHSARSSGHVARRERPLRSGNGVRSGTCVMPPAPHDQGQGGGCPCTDGARRPWWSRACWRPRAAELGREPPTPGTEGRQRPASRSGVLSARCPVLRGCGQTVHRPSSNQGPRGPRGARSRGAGPECAQRSTPEERVGLSSQDGDAWLGPDLRGNGAEGLGTPWARSG